MTTAVRTVSLRDIARTLRTIRIGDRWRDPDGLLWTVRQIHRPDRTISLEHPGRPAREIRVPDLLQHWRWHADREGRP